MISKTREEFLSGFFNVKVTHTWLKWTYAFCEVICELWMSDSVCNISAGIERVREKAIHFIHGSRHMPSEDSLRLLRMSLDAQHSCWDNLLPRLMEKKKDKVGLNEIMEKFMKATDAVNESVENLYLGARYPDVGRICRSNLINDLLARSTNLSDELKF